MSKIEYYSKFEKSVSEALVKIGKEKGYIGEHLLEVEELEEKWHEMAPEYMVNAVPEIARYPMVAVAWAAYIGMGMAAVWDGDWQAFSQRADLYQELIGPRGFDYADEHIMQTYLGIAPGSKEFEDIASLYQVLAEAAITLIRKEGFEPQSVDAFHIYARTVKVFYRIGVSVALKMLGYKYEKMSVPQA